MHIKSISIKGFRSIRDCNLTFEPSLTTLVGENSTGKTTISLALNNLLAACQSALSMAGSDYPYGVFIPVSIQATLYYN